VAPNPLSSPLLSSAESTIEARIIGLQDLKQAVVGEIINESNSGADFVRATGSTDSTGADQGKPPRPGSGLGGFGATLWNSVRTSVTDGPTSALYGGPAVSEVRVWCDMT
jgi:hypothetical protein